MLARRAVTLAALSLSLAACTGPGAEESGGGSGVVGEWRAVLASPGGELPFGLRIVERDGGLAGVVVNGEEEAPLSGVTASGSTVVLAFDWYDAEISARLEAGGAAMTGRWRKTVPAGESSLAFRASRGAAPRFDPLPAGTASGERSAPASVAGSWAIVFTDEDGSEPARGELRQEGARVTGTILTPTGDYRYLDGVYRAGRLRLSTFDGAHAFLFDAHAAGDALSGDFWSRDTYHATWTGRRIQADESVLPDAWSLVGLRNDDGRFTFSFPDLEGREVSLADPRFAGKVVVVNIFGSWCPNCNDKAPLLAAWHRRYRDRGLEIVGLAYEFSGDPTRDGRLVRRFAERHGIDFPLLLAGTSDKRRAAATLPDLTAVVAFPTTVFVGRDGRARKIHTGFAGPGTGAHHDRLVAELEGTLEALLAES